MKPNYTITGQNYYVLKLTINDYLFDFTNYHAQMTVLSDRQALLIVTMWGNIFNGTITLDDWLEGYLDEENHNEYIVNNITYRILCPDMKGQTLRSEDYFHEFKGRVKLKDAINGWIMEHEKSLFKLHPLNDLLDTKNFRGIDGVQFVN